MQSQEETMRGARPRLLYAGAAWAVAKTLVAAIVLIDMVRFVISSSLFVVGGPTWLAFLPGIVNFLVFLAIAIALLKARNWGRVGFLLMSLASLLNLGSIRFLGWYLLPVIYPVIGILLASWLFNQPSVLSYFDAYDLRPKWISTKRLFGVQIDLALGIGFLGIAIPLEIFILIFAVATSDRI